MDNEVVAPHAGQLVCLEGGKLVPCKDPSNFTAPYTILFFSAGWCPDCRKFSPGLVAAYDAQPAGHRGFEVLFISQDRSEAEMHKFMATEKMHWPALAYSQVPGAHDLEKFHPKKSIPWLTVIDRSGQVKFQSESDKDANEVLKALQAKLAADGKRK